MCEQDNTFDPGAHFAAQRPRDMFELGNSLWEYNAHTCVWTEVCCVRRHITKLHMN